MSFRAEQSEAKNLDYIHVGVFEILRFALNDKRVAIVNDNKGIYLPYNLSIKSLRPMRLSS